MRKPEVGNAKMPNSTRSDRKRQGFAVRLQMALTLLAISCPPAALSIGQEIPTNLGNPSIPPPLPSTNTLLTPTQGGGPSTAQPTPVSQPSNPATTASMVPSLSSQPSTSSRVRTQVNGNFQLPKDAGQYWEEYDLRPYTDSMKTMEKPEQAIIDWVLRETGTDAWFTQPMGVLNVDRSTLRVYHNESMQKTVKQVYERFVNGASEEQVYGLRMITINNPNWRTRAVGWMKSVQVQSPGVHAWLLSKENLAMLLAMLRGRSDVKEVQSADLAIFNGQTSTLEQLRSRNYVREYQKAEQGWPPYLPITSELQEGYRLQISPLLNTDHRMLDVVLKCNIDQVERLNSVNIDLPMVGGPNQTTQVQVPQVASWRLHERFRWPADQVLLLSCGVVAAPNGKVDNTLLGQGANTLGLNKIIAPTAAGDRTDAILILEYKGSKSTQLNPGSSANAAQFPSTQTRGRY